MLNILEAINKKNNKIKYILFKKEYFVKLI